MFEITFKDSDETEHTCSGVYLEVEELQTLRFTWNWKSEPGAESLVTVNFKQPDAFTRMHFEHANIGTASQHNYREGWSRTFAKLEQVLEAL